MQTTDIFDLPAASCEPIKQLLRQLNTQGPHVIVGTLEGAGILAIATDLSGCRYGVAVSHRPHVGSLQKLPERGVAASICRSVQEVNSYGAEVIALADSLCLGGLHDARMPVMQVGIVKQMANYSNQLGLANLAGDLSYDPLCNESYLATVVALGIVRENEIIPSAVSKPTEDRVLIAVGHQADKGEIPNALLQRHLLKANTVLLAKLRDESLLQHVSLKSVGESGAGSFIWSVPSSLVDKILYHYNHTFALPEMRKGACAAIIEKMPTTKQATYKDVIDRSNDILQKAMPLQLSLLEPTLPACDANQVLLTLLAHEAIASRAPMTESYDKQVQGRTHIEAGLADAGVLQPFNDEAYPEEIRKVGVVLSLDQSICYSKINSYWGAVNAVVEAVRNVVAMGAKPLAITSCLCGSDPKKSEQMKAFIESIKGILDASSAITLNGSNETLPVVAGSVSFQASAVDVASSSPVVGCIGVLDDINQVITGDLKRPETALLLLGERRNECGGSVYYQLHHVLGANVPKPDLTTLNKEIHTLYAALRQRLVLSVHDISAGGVAVTLAEMSFKNNIGVNVNIPGDLRDEIKLFSETGGFILEVSRDKVKEVKKLFEDQQMPLFHLGETTLEPRLKMNKVIDVTIQVAKSAWENGLRKKLQ